MHVRLLTIAVLSLSLFGCSTSRVEGIVLERRNASDQIPEECSQQHLVAEKAFREKWIAYLLDPAETTLVKPSTQRITGATYLAPVGSYRIALNEWTLTNRMVSAFINCERREGYVQARGGLTDHESWYGPFKF